MRYGTLDRIGVVRDKHVTFLDGTFPALEELSNWALLAMLLIDNIQEVDALKLPN